MDRKNMAIIGVAAVVIAICLVASYTYLAGGGSDDETGTREMGLGDYYLATVTMTDEEGTMQYLQEVTVVGIDGDTYTVRNETNWAGVSDIDLVGWSTVF